MSQELTVLLTTAALVGFFHTILGPDHYIPFIVIAKARKWTSKKLFWITLICGMGHVLSSVLIGMVGIAFGVALNKLEYVESFRGDIAAWLLIVFGLTYSIWGIKKAIRKKPHTHFHFHENGFSHSHSHQHTGSHLHAHHSEEKSKITSWVLFTIFIFGPCEALIPILMYPASRVNLTGLVLVTAIFAIVTIGTMLAIVFLILKGINFFPVSKFERYMHASAGFVILLCGRSIKFFEL